MPTRVMACAPTVGAAVHCARRSKRATLAQRLSLLCVSAKSPYFLTQGIPLTITTNLKIVAKEPFRIDGCRPRPSPVPGGTPVSWTPPECRKAGSHPTNVLQISNVGTQGTVEISGVSIQYGQSPIGYFGTGIRIDTGSSLLLKKSAVIENRSGVGGVGIFTDGSLTLIGCTVERNEVGGGGGGVTGIGAGIDIGSKGWVTIIGEHD